MAKILFAYDCDACGEGFNGDLPERCPHCGSKAFSRNKIAAGKVKTTAFVDRAAMAGFGRFLVKHPKATMSQVTEFVTRLAVEPKAGAWSHRQRFDRTLAGVTEAAGVAGGMVKLGAEVEMAIGTSVIEVRMRGRK